MGVKYKYASEDEIVFSGANGWEINQLDDIEVTYYQPVGLMVNSVTGEEYFYTASSDRFTDEIIDNPDFEYVTRDNGSTFWAIPVEQKYQLEKRFGTNRYEINLDNTALYSDKLELAVARSFDTKQPFPVDGTPSSQIDFPTRPISFSSWVLVWHQNFPSGSLANWTFQPPFLWHPIPDLVAQFKLDILLDNTIIYSRIERFQPEYVQLFDRECPQDTCPVKCAENVCCYGSDGEAVESFLFSESTYQS